MDVSDSNSRQQLRCWLVLIRAPGIGPITLYRLIQTVGDVRRLLEEPDRLREFAFKPQTLTYLSRPDWHAVDADIDWLSRPDRHLISIEDPRYPARLRQIADPPIALFLSGNPDLLQTPQIAVVVCFEVKVYLDQNFLSLSTSVVQLYTASVPFQNSFFL